MAINNPIIDAGPTTSKADANTAVCYLIEPTAPGTFNYVKIVDGVVESGTASPQWEGQLLTVKLDDIPSVTLYVAVSAPVPPTEIVALAWRQVSTKVVFEDPRTGKEKDPAYDLYFP